MAPKGRNNSWRSCSRVSSDKFVTRMELSSLPRRILSPSLVLAPPRLDGGMYDPFALAAPADPTRPPMSSSIGGFSPPTAKPFVAANSLKGHLEVQWSPFFPHVLQTISDAFPRLARSAPFSISCFEPAALVLSRKISSVDTTVRFSEAFWPTASPNFFRDRRRIAAGFSFFTYNRKRYKKSKNKKNMQIAWRGKDSTAETLKYLKIISKT